MTISSTAIPDNILRRMEKAQRPKGNAGLTSEESEQKRIAKSEREIQEQIANLLRQRGIWFHRSRMDKRTTGPKGTPDFLFAVDGRACAIEVKMPGKTLSDDQRVTLHSMIANGWQSRLVGSAGDALAFIKVLEAE